MDLDGAQQENLWAAKSMISRSGTMYVNSTVYFPSSNTFLWNTPLILCLLSIDCFYLLRLINYKSRIQSSHVPYHILLAAIGKSLCLPFSLICNGYCISLHMSLHVKKYEDLPLLLLSFANNRTSLSFILLLILYFFWSKILYFSINFMTLLSYTVNNIKKIYKSFYLRKFQQIWIPYIEAKSFNG
jgi:Zn-dependent protease with chaperone function